VKSFFFCCWLFGLGIWVCKDNLWCTQECGKVIFLYWSREKSFRVNLY